MRTLSFLACLALSGCASTPAVMQTKTVTVSKPVYVPLDASLTSDVPIPSFPAKTPLLNRDLVNYLVSIHAALEQANAKLDAIRALQPKADKTP